MVDALDFRLLNDFQRNFPLSSQPYAEIGKTLGVGEGEVLQRLQALAQSRKISRVGAVLAPRSFGASSLVAMAVPAERLEEVAATVNRFPGVNHNYARRHHFNLWFVAAAACEQTLSRLLDYIERATGLPLLRLPLLEEFHIDLGFSLHGEVKTESRSRPSQSSPMPLADHERRLLSVLQEGLPLLERPFAAMAERMDSSESAVCQGIESWLNNGAIKRFGIIVRHRELGFSANAMLVHDVPDARTAEVGRALAGESAVTLCYRRPRILPDWPYNLFCMIHGREHAEVEAQIAELREKHGLQSIPHAILFSETCFKQTGARYV